jgi:LCP family protein required for cell wall assembly
VNEWPTGWFREDKPAAPQDGNAMPGAAGGSAAAGSAAAGSAASGSAAAGGASGTAGAANDPTVRLPAGAGAGGSSHGAGGSGYPAGGASYAGTATGAPANPWPSQPPPRSAPGRLPQGSPTYGRGGRRTRRPRLRLFLAFLAGLVVVLLILVIGGYFYLDGKLHRSNVLVSYAGQPAAGAGSNWLITGSDSRQGLTRKQERKYHTGINIGGQRSDTILLLHIPGSGPAVLVSLPRDSYVKIPGYGWNKLNAAYSFGGPKLLAQTVQNATGLRIEHYMGIGFGGLVNVVNSVGGVTMCFKHPLHDTASGLHLKKGCQTLSGGKALSFVRTRHNFASQDLQREQNQRVFLKALLSKMTSTGVMFNPFSVVPAALGTVDSVSVDDGTHLNQLISVAFALRQPQTTTVPIANSNLPTAAGDAVQWDSAQAGRLFHDLNTDTPLPKHLLSGSHLQG